ncbi:hypothetical protein JCM9279_002917 [Rhodotorula babjevae]
MARSDIGRKPAELDMLLSPSRGLLAPDDDDDEASLRNPEVQERFREHVAAKMTRWSTAHPAGRSAEARKQRMQELGIILLDFRKLREGILSSRRIDSFACEAYTASVLLAIYASNDPQLSSSLPHLVQALHSRPSRADSVASTSTAPPASLDTALAHLSLAPADSPSMDERAFFISLFLLHAHLLPAFTTLATPSTPSTTSTSSNPPSSFLPTLFALLRSSDLPPPTSLYPSPQHPSPHITHLLALYHALLRPSSASLARLFSPAHVPPLPPTVAALARTLHLPSSFHPTSALLWRAAPRVRDALLWPPLRRAYKFPPDPVEWVAHGLLFEMLCGLIFHGLNILLLIAVTGATLYYNWPALSTRTFATDMASISQYVGAVSGAAATVTFVILAFVRGGVGSCTTLTAGLAALFAVADVVCYAIWSFKGQMGTVWYVAPSLLVEARAQAYPARCRSEGAQSMTSEVSTAVSKYVQCDAEWMRIALMVLFSVSASLQLSIAFSAVASSSCSSRPATTAPPAQSLGRPATGMRSLATRKSRRGRYARVGGPSAPIEEDEERRLAGKGDVARSSLSSTESEVDEVRWKGKEREVERD